MGDVGLAGGKSVLCSLNGSSYFNSKRKRVAANRFATACMAMGITIPDMTIKQALTEKIYHNPSSNGIFIKIAFANPSNVVWNK